MADSEIQETEKKIDPATVEFGRKFKELAAAVHFNDLTIAGRTGFPQAQVKEWLDGESRPTLHQFWQAVYEMELNIRGEKLEKSPSSTPPSPTEVRRARAARALAKLENDIKHHPASNDDDDEPDIHSDTAVTAFIDEVPTNGYINPKGLPVVAHDQLLHHALTALDTRLVWPETSIMGMNWQELFYAHEGNPAANQEWLQLQPLECQLGLYLQSARHHAVGTLQDISKKTGLKPERIAKLEQEILTSADYSDLEKLINVYQTTMFKDFVFDRKYVFGLLTWALDPHRDESHVNNVALNEISEALAHPLNRAADKHRLAHCLGASQRLLKLTDAEAAQAIGCTEDDFVQYKEAKKTPLAEDMEKHFLFCENAMNTHGKRLDKKKFVRIYGHSLKAWKTEHIDGVSQFFKRTIDDAAFESRIWESKNENQRFTTLVRACRERLKLTQAQLRTQTGITPGRYSGVESPTDNLFALDDRDIQKIKAVCKEALRTLPDNNPDTFDAWFEEYFTQIHAISRAARRIHLAEESRLKATSGKDAETPVTQVADATVSDGQASARGIE